MRHLLDLLAAIALLIWGTHLVRTGILTGFGTALRDFLGRNVSNRWTAFAAGLGVTALVQSSTATALIASSFVGQALLSLPLALAVMLGADVGTSLIAALLSFDLSWLSPFLIFAGVVLSLSRPSTQLGRLGRIAIGLGLMLLALRLVTGTTTVMTQSTAIRALLGAMTSDLMLAVTLGAMLSVLAYSSLAIVLLTATAAGTGLISPEAAVALVLGANLGSGLLAVLTTMRSGIEARQLPLGNLIFKVIGVAAIAPFIGLWVKHAGPHVPNTATLVVFFHLTFNLIVATLFIGLTQVVARWVRLCLPKPEGAAPAERPRHLDPSALATPSLALACAAREAMHQADIVENMLQGMLHVLKHNDLKLAHELRALDDTVDELYSAIKYYLTSISREALGGREASRWTEIIGFTINMEQIADIVERILIDVEDRKIAVGRSFSDAGTAELTELHGRLIGSLRLAMSVFLNGSVRDAQKLLDAKVRFRDLERAYSASHLDRLAGNSRQSMETSSLHLDLISDLKRINSHICSIAYPVLESAGPVPHDRHQPVHGVE